MTDVRRSASAYGTAALITSDIVMEDTRSGSHHQPIQPGTCTWFGLLDQE